MKNFILAALAGAACASKTVDWANEDWGYSNNGMEWPGQCYFGKQQSPINIETDNEFNRGYLRADLIQFSDFNNMSFLMKTRRSGKKANDSPTLTGFQQYR